MPTLPPTANIPIVDRLYKYGGFCPHPSSTVDKKGWSYFDEVETDTHVRATLAIRARRAITPGFQIEPASTSKRDQEIASFVEWNLREIKGTFLTDLEQMMTAVGRGYSLFEKQYQVQAGGKFPNTIRLTNLKLIPTKLVRFDFDETGQVKDDGVVLANYLPPFTGGQKGGSSAGGQKEGSSAGGQKAGSSGRFPYARFLHCTFGNTDNPYGDGTDLYTGFWSWIKKNAVQFWAVYSETFGMPVTAVELLRNTSKETQEKARQLVDDLQARSGIVIPPGMTMKFLEAVRAGDGGYDSLIKTCDQQISEINNGGTLISQNAAAGQSGGYALGQTQSVNTDAMAYTDALWLEYQANQLIRELVDLNYETNDYPRLVILDDDLALMVGLSQSILQLAQAGLEIPKQWLYQRLGIPAPTSTDDLLSPPVNAGTQGGASTPGQQPDNRTYRRPFDRGRSAAASRASSFILHPSSFSSDPREQVLNGIQDDVFDRLQPKIVSLTDKALAQVSEQLPEGNLPDANNWPKLSFNVGSIKKTLQRAMLQHYCVGKQFGVRELEQGQVPVPSKSAPMPPAPSGFSSRASSFILHPSSFSEASLTLADEELTPAELLALLATEIPLTEQELTAILSRFEARAFTIAGLVKTDIERIFQNQLLALREGWDLRTFSKAVKDDVIKYAGDVFGSQATGEALSGYRIELVYRNAVNAAFADGKQALVNDPDLADEIWGFYYDAILDSRVRPTHAALHGTTRAKDDELWDYRRPPWSWNCRCDLRIITNADIESGRYQETDVPAYDKSEGFS